MTNGPLAHEIYVWQRVWSPEVRAGVECAEGISDGFCVLLAELDWRDDHLELARAAVDYAFLAARKKPVGLALRVGLAAGAPSPESRIFPAVVSILRDALERAAAAGLSVAECQLDFDCPTSRLADYARGVRAISTALPGVPLAVTVLPSWLEDGGFAKLADAAGHFVLQLHSVPTAAGAEPILCDLRAARKAISRAAKFGVPFRVALPTYSHELIRDTDGRIVRVQSERDTGALQPGEKSEFLRADPVALAGLLAELRAERPAMLGGILWYRLPVATDRLNWRWPTLASLIHGTVPIAHGALTFQQTAATLTDLVLENHGDADWTLPLTVTVRWPRAELLGVDALVGWTVANCAPQTLLFTRTQPARTLTPGAHLALGWVRLDAPAPLTSDLP